MWEMFVQLKAYAKDRYIRGVKEDGGEETYHAFLTPQAMAKLKMDQLKAEAAKWATQEEDVLTYAMFPQVAPKFFEKRNAKKQGVDGDHVDYTNQSHPV
jgi:pyruvate/oxaloacetate carboxyltransferase